LGAPELQRSIRDAKAARGPLKAPVLHIGRVLNSNILGSTANVLQPSTENNSALDRSHELGV
jgi:hypothetical protein